MKLLSKKKIDNLNLSSTYIAQVYREGTTSKSAINHSWQGGSNTTYIHLLIPRKSDISSCYMIDGIWNQNIIRPEQTTVSRFLLGIFVYSGDNPTIKSEICIINPQCTSGTTTPITGYTGCYVCTETKNDKNYLGIYFTLGYYGMAYIENIFQQDNNYNVSVDRSQTLIERVTTLPATYTTATTKYIKPTAS